MGKIDKHYLETLEDLARGTGITSQALEDALIKSITYIAKMQGIILQYSEAQAILSSLSYETKWMLSSLFLEIEWLYEIEKEDIPF